MSQHIHLYEIVAQFLTLQHEQGLLQSIYKSKWVKYYRVNGKAPAYSYMGIPGTKLPGIVICILSLKRFNQMQKWTTYIQAIVRRPSRMRAQPVWHYICVMVTHRQNTSLDWNQSAHILESPALLWEDHWEYYCSRMHMCRWLDDSLAITKAAPQDGSLTAIWKWKVF